MKEYRTIARQLENETITGTIGDAMKKMKHLWTSLFLRFRKLVPVYVFFFDPIFPPILSA